MFVSYLVKRKEQIIREDVLYTARFPDIKCLYSRRPLSCQDEDKAGQNLLCKKPMTSSSTSRLLLFLYFCIAPSSSSSLIIFREGVSEEEEGKFVS